MSIFVPGSSNEDVDDIYNDIDDNNNNDDGDDNPGENLAPHS